MQIHYLFGDFIDQKRRLKHKILVESIKDFIFISLLDLKKLTMDLKQF